MRTSGIRGAEAVRRPGDKNAITAAGRGSERDNVGVI
jgi:hypothetical protein